MVVVVFSQQFQSKTKDSEDYQCKQECEVQEYSIHIIEELAPNNTRDKKQRGNYFQSSGRINRYYGYRGSG